MIRLGLDVAAAILLSAVALLMLGIWMGEHARSGRRPGSEDDEAGNVCQCPYCRHLCVNDQHAKVMICPVCKSYFEEEAP